MRSRKVADRVRRLLVENVSAHAQLVDIDSFRMRFADPGVQRAISVRRRWLIGKFREYCAADASQAATSENAGARVALVAGALAVSLARDVDVARAFVGDIALDDVRYEAMERCPENQYVPNKQKTTCLRFTARATNAVKGRTIESANVFGFVEDAQGNSAATVNADGNSRTVLASIDAPIPKGESDVHFVVTVFKDSLENNGPLRLKAFKAVGSVADIDKRFTPFDACEVDPDSCL